MTRKLTIICNNCGRIKEDTFPHPTIYANTWLELKWYRGSKEHYNTYDLCSLFCTVEFLKELQQ